MKSSREKTGTANGAADQTSDVVFQERVSMDASVWEAAHILAMSFLPRKAKQDLGMSANSP
jgi:hypothetical protein